MRALITLLFIALISSSFSAELVLQGVYRGKDIYVKNPYDPSTSTFCTDKVLVNDNVVMESPRASAFKIDLGHLKMGALVVIRIEYKDGCAPQIINPQVLSEEKGFKFLSSRASANSIDWTTEGEFPSGVFSVEQEIYGVDRKYTWEMLSQIEGKGNITSNRYSVSPNHFPGDNKYRIRYDSPEKEAVYSVEIVYTSTKNPITFYPLSVTTQLTLSESTDYEITDRNGRIVKSGFGSNILLQELRSGEYYLHIQNRIEKFVKK